MANGSFDELRAMRARLETARRELDLVIEAIDNAIRDKPVPLRSAGELWAEAGKAIDVGDSEHPLRVVPMIRKTPQNNFAKMLQRRRPSH
jgi:hypothetical protein